MHVLVIQNVEGEGTGQLGAALAEANARIDHRHPYAGQTLPSDSSEHDAIIVLGGPQNALDDEACPYFAQLLDLIRDFEAKDRAILGVCLGSQLMARAFGGRNQVGGASEFGWQPVTLTEAARADPVLGGLPQQFPSFEWHDDTFSLPEAAVHLAGNDTVPNQAFRIGRAAYAIQFHFEADTSVVRRWNEVFAPLIAQNHPDWPQRYAQQAALHAPTADATGMALARAWVAVI